MEKEDYIDFSEVEAKINELEELAAAAMDKSDEVVREAIYDCRTTFAEIGAFIDTERKYGSKELPIESAERIQRVCKKLLQVHLANNYDKDNLIFPVCTDDGKEQYIAKGMGCIVYFEHHNLMCQYVRVTEFGYKGGSCRWNLRGVSLLLKDRLKTPKLLTKKICGKNHVVCDIDYEDFLMSDISI